MSKKKDDDDGGHLWVIGVVLGTVALIAVLVIGWCVFKP